MADIPGDASTTASLAVGGSVTGSVEVVDDHDWYRITLTAGQSVTVSLTGITLTDTYLNIRDASGNIIFSNDDVSDGNLSSQVSFSAPSTGTYYIDVSAWHDPTGAYQGTGTYQVSVQPYSPPPLATNDQIAGQLVSGYWGGDSHHFNVTQGGTITVNISTLNAGEQALARAALQEWSDIIGVRFQEVLTSSAQIRFDNTEDTSGNPIAATDARWSNGIETSAHVHISSSWVNRYGTSLYSYSMQTYVHEIGHALGLGHAGNYNNTATYPYDALFQNDAWSTSIMSYFDQQQNTYFGGRGFTVNFAVTPMAADILAMQQLYGLSTTTRTGDTTYGFNSNAGGVFNASAYPRAAYTIFDSAGNDTLDFSGSAASQLLNLNPETFSNVNGYVGNLSIARGVIIENATGGSGADTIIGNSVANVLRGGAGADNLSGGGGNDTFLDTKAGHNGDTITDFGAGDSIVFSDATLGSFTFSLSDKTLTYSGGSLTFGSVPVGAIGASAAASGGVQLTLGAATTPTHHPLNDFNGDGKSDILWRADDGTVTDWLGQPNGTFVDNSASFNIAVPTDWHIAGTGDFNGDGRADILWRAGDGTVRDWLGQANGGFVGNVSNLNIGVPNSWQIAAIGDFNGDGRSDILWRHEDGTVRDWLGQANGGFIGNMANLNATVPYAFHIVGTGDFNGDRIDDILWRSDDGTVSDWLGQSSGGFISNVENVNVNVPNAFHIMGVGDFNGDGRSDILWRSDDGTVSDWLGQANGAFASNAANFNVSVPTSSCLVGIGDYNSDAIDDILWRSNNGQVTEWLGQSNGGFIDNSATVNIAVSTMWHVQAPFVHDPFA